MLIHILTKEIHLNLLNIRFKVASTLILFVFITGSILNHLQYPDEAETV